MPLISLTNINNFQLPNKGNALRVHFDTLNREEKRQKGGTRVVHKVCWHLVLSGKISLTDHSYGSKEILTIHCSGIIIGAK